MRDMMVSYMYRDNDTHEYRGDMYHHAGKMMPGTVRIKYCWCCDKRIHYGAVTTHPDIVP